MLSTNFSKVALLYGSMHSKASKGEFLQDVIKVLGHISRHMCIRANSLQKRLIVELKENNE